MKTNYKIQEIKSEDDKIGIILQGEVFDDDGNKLGDDGFATWIDREVFESMDEEALHSLIKEKVKKRKELIRSVFEKKEHRIDEKIERKLKSIKISL